MYADRFLEFAEQIINKDGQAGDMIHVGVGHDYIANSALLRFTQRNADTPGVNRHPIVDDKARQALRGTSATLRIERAW